MCEKLLYRKICTDVCLKGLGFHFQKFVSSFETICRKCRNNGGFMGINLILWKNIGII